VRRRVFILHRRGQLRLAVLDTLAGYVLWLRHSDALITLSNPVYYLHGVAPLTEIRIICYGTQRNL